MMAVGSGARRQASGLELKHTRSIFTPASHRTGNSSPSPRSSEESQTSAA